MVEAPAISRKTPMQQARGKVHEKAKSRLASHHGASLLRRPPKMIPKKKKLQARFLLRKAPIFSA